MRINKKIWLAAGIVLFTFYFFFAARPIPFETVLTPRWIHSLNSNAPIILEAKDQNEKHSVTAFTLGNQFGFISNNGKLLFNKEKNNNISLSPDFWSEYEAQPDRITVYENDGRILVEIDDPLGYPFFIDNRIFIINSEQNAVQEIDFSGKVLWSYDFACQIICADAASGLFLAGTLDGEICVLDNNGRRIFSFEPGGSRYSVIAGCAISANGNDIAIIAGLDSQRFLHLKRSGTAQYKVVYHEFLESGFSRPVLINFIQNDQWVVFECYGGLGFYQVDSRKTEKVSLNGKINSIDNRGGMGLVFTVISPAENRKELIGIQLPDNIMLRASFKSVDFFLDRIDSRLITGGENTLIAFDLERR